MSPAHLGFLPPVDDVDASAPPGQSPRELYAAYDERNLDQLDPDTRLRLRAGTYAFIGALPPLEGDLQTWITATRPGLEAAVAQLVETPKHTAGQTLRSGAPHAQHDATAAFSPPPKDLTPQTVHAIKGEDRDAVMVVVRKPHASDPAKQLKLFETALSGDEISAAQEEERRVTYVALTRVERYCLLAVPDNPRRSQGGGAARGDRIRSHLSADGLNARLLLAGRRSCCSSRRGGTAASESRFCTSSNRIARVRACSR